MIRSRRQAHRFTFVVLALFLPAVLVAGLALRSGLPPVGEPARELANQSGFATAPDGVSVLVADGTLDVTLRRETDGSTVMTIRPTSVILKPDLLVYWVPDAEPPADALPGEGAVLVGSLAGTSRRRLALPDGAGQGDGQIVVYSLGHREVAARFPLRAVVDSMPGHSR